MNVKALAAIVGTLSLGALATGCASNKAAEGTTEGAATTETKGAEAKCNAESKGTEAKCSADKAGATEAKGTNASCSEAACSAKK